MQYDSAQSVRWKFADGNQRRFGNPVCGVRSHENTPAHEVKKWTNVGEFVHPFAIFDGQNEYCYVVDFVQESIGPLSWYLGVAPEKAQSFGQRSKENLSRLVFDRNVTVEWRKKDRYGRTVGKVMVAEASCRESNCPKVLDAGHAQIVAGMAWWYRQYAKEQELGDANRYEQSEQEARTRRIGLWTDPQPTPPWEWRKERKHHAQ